MGRWFIDPVELEVGVEHVFDANVGYFGGAMVKTTLPKSSELTIQVPAAPMGREMLVPVFTPMESSVTNRTLVLRRRGCHCPGFRQGAFIRQHMVVEPVFCHVVVATPTLPSML